MKSAIIKSREISSGYQYRLKPNGFLLEGKRIFANLKNNSALKGMLTNIVKDVYRPGIFKRIFIKKPECGLPYITAQAMMTAMPLVYSKILSVKLTDNLESMILHRGDILVSCAGTIGNIRLVDKFMDKAVGSQDIIRVKTQENYGFVYAYLASTAVYSFLQSQLYGSVVPRIEPDIVKNIPLVHFNTDKQIHIDALIKKSLTLREEAINDLENAKEMLSSLINVSHFNHAYKTDVVSSKTIWTSLQHRLDPPALMNDGVVTMNKVISEFTYKTIGTINAKVHRPGIFKRSYVENGIPYIKGSEIFLTNPFRRCEQLSKTRTPFIDEMALSEGQILITCAGSVGNIKMITKEYEDKKAIGSQDIIRLVSEDSLFTSEYLFTYLQLPFVFDYIQSMKYGSVIERIEPFHVESIPVIEPTQELSDEISCLIKQYMSKTYRAFNCEEQAISMVEQEIEKWNK